MNVDVACGVGKAPQTPRRGGPVGQGAQKGANTEICCEVSHTGGRSSYTRQYYGSVVWDLRVTWLQIAGGGRGVSRPFVNASECRWYRHANWRTRRALHHRGCPCSLTSGLCNHLAGKSVGSLPVLLIVPDYRMVHKLILGLYLIMVSVTPEYNVERFSDNNEMMWKGAVMLCLSICWMDWGNSRHCR